MFGIELTTLVQFLGYPGLAAIIFLESGVFFGFFLPGASLLFVSGVLASLGFFNIWILAPLIIFAAILGDNVGYWFGAWMGKAIYAKPDSRFFKHQHVRMAHDFFERYGKASVLLARFVPIARTFVPILAGVAGMNYSVFLFYNVVGALIWAGGFTTLGYVLGEQIPNAEEYITPIILGIIALTMIPIAFTWWKTLHTERAESENA